MHLSYIEQLQLIISYPAAQKKLHPNPASFRERDGPELLEVSLQRFMLGTMALCQELFYGDGCRAPARGRIRHVTHHHLLGLGVVSHEIPAITVGTRVDQDIFSLERPRINLSEQTVRPKLRFPLPTRVTLGQSGRTGAQQDVLISITASAMSNHVIALSRSPDSFAISACSQRRA
jgi:hypothetical protein